ncbi:MAG: HK97 family phage prohead protease [Candidatus Limnocylindrus sp.]
MSYLIVDIDGTLTTSGDAPRQDFIDWLKSQVQDMNEEVIIVSARPISRLAETRDWLNEHNVPHAQVHLNDFSETPGPNVALSFKKYKYELLIKEYGTEEIEMVIDNDADVRAMAESLGLKAVSPDDAMAETDVSEEEEAALEQRATYDVPEYIRDAARKGLEWYEQGRTVLLQADPDEPVAEARELVAGRVDSDKLIRMAAWIRRHRGDWEGVPQNSDASNEDFPGPGAVAGFLWGVETTQDGAADRVLSWADRLVAAEESERFDVKEKEVRSVPMGEFRIGEVDSFGQRMFSGYAAIFGSPSEGLPFEERIAPGAFKRSLARASAGQKIIAFLFGHDEARSLATTASGRLQLTEDERGLRVDAKLDPSDPDAAKVISMLTHESAAAGMSFGFQKVSDEWNGNSRTIKEANLFEVSILAAGGQTPAYPATLGLTAIRQVTAPKIGVDADALMATLESVKAGRELSAEETEVLDAVRSKLAPRKDAIDPSVALALAEVERAAGESL